MRNFSEIILGKVFIALLLIITSTLNQAQDGTGHLPVKKSYQENLIVVIGAMQSATDFANACSERLPHRKPLYQAALGKWHEKYQAFHNNMNNRLKQEFQNAPSQSLDAAISGLQKQGSRTLSMLMQMNDVAANEWCNPLPIKLLDKRGLFNIEREFAPHVKVILSRGGDAKSIDSSNDAAPLSSVPRLENSKLLISQAGARFKDCSNCPELVVLPAGSFERGGEASRVDPIHTVTISRPFAIGITEVTRRQWKSVMGSDPSTAMCDGDCPVDTISFDNAQEFVRKLSLATKYTYRLPSEAEWEYACRASEKHTYCGSDNVNAVAWYDGEIPVKHPIALKQPNKWGVYDMSGNVREWVQDCMVFKVGYIGAPTDGSPRIESDCKHRVSRGGTYHSPAVQVQADHRVGVEPKNTARSLGLRIVREID